ncbi:hypothetical protein ACRAWD_05260 [Caulobacter segnis]
MEATAANLGFKLFHGGEDVDPADIAANEPAVVGLFGLENVLNKWIIHSINFLIDFSSSDVFLSRRFEMALKTD